MVQRCGGCPWLLSERADERAHKLRQLRAELAGIASDLTLEWIEGHRRTEYRNRIRLRIAEDGSVCFFNPHKTFTCAVLEPALRRAVDRLVALGRSHSGALQPLAHVEVRTPDAKGRPSAFFTARDPNASLPEATRAALTELSAAGFVIHVHEADGSDVPVQRYPLLAPSFADVPLGTFMQVNTEVNRLLVARILGEARRARARTFADLFAGSGNFSIPLAADGLSGVAVERSAASIRALERVSREEGLPLDPVAGDAIAAAATWAARGVAFDLTVVDAPRAGIKHGHEFIAEISARAVMLCSCNPKTFARDIGRLLTAGFRLASVSALDMFPGTEHLEVLGVLYRAHWA